MPNVAFETDLPFQILPDTDYKTAEIELAAIGADLLVETLKDLPHLQEQSTPQDASQATFARKLISADAKIDWEDMTAVDVVRRHRGISHQVCPQVDEMPDRRATMLTIPVLSVPLVDFRTWQATAAARPS